MNRRIIEANDEEIFYREMDQAKILCLARNAPPDGLGLKGDVYETFSAELGYSGKAGKTLPRLYHPYGAKVIAWVQSEQEKARARGQKYDFPSWREAYAEMQKQWEPPPVPKGKNSRGADEELVDPAVERARLISELAARDAKFAAAEVKAKAEAEILDQRIKTEVWKREEAEDNLLKARLIIAELQAEIERLKAALPATEPDPDPDPPPVDSPPTTDDARDKPDADALAPAATVAPADPAADLADMIRRSEQASADRRAAISSMARTDDPDTVPPTGGVALITGDVQPTAVIPTATASAETPKPPVVAATAPVDAPRRGRKRQPTEKQLKLVAARALKVVSDDPAPLTCAKVKCAVDPLWNSLDTENFEADWRAAFRRHVVNRLWATVTDQTFKLDDLEMAWWASGDKRDPHVLTWDEANGFRVRDVELDAHPDDPDDGGGSGKPTTASLDSLDGAEAGSAMAGDTKSETPSENSAQDMAIQTIEQLNAALQPAIQTIRAMPERSPGARHDDRIFRARDILKEIWANTAPDLHADFITAATLADISTGPKPDGEVLFWRDRHGGSSVEMIRIIGPKAGPTVSSSLKPATDAPLSSERKAILHLRNQRLADVTEIDQQIDSEVAARPLNTQGRMSTKAIETRKKLFGVVGKIVALGGKPTPKAVEIFAELVRRKSAYWTKREAWSINDIINEIRQEHNEATEMAKPRHQRQLSDSLMNDPETWRRDFDGWGGVSLSGLIARRTNYQELLALSSESGDATRMKYCNTVIGWLNEMIAASQAGGRDADGSTQPIASEKPNLP